MEFNINTTINDMGKVYYQSIADGELHELGPAIDLTIGASPGEIVTGTIAFEVTHETFKKTDDYQISNLYPSFMTTSEIKIGDLKFGDGGFMCVKDSNGIIEERVVNLSSSAKEEKKEGNKMKLVEMYKERASKIINEARNVEKENVLNNNPIVKQYKKLIEEFEKAQEELYMNQAIDNMIIDIKNSDNMYKYGISYSIRHAMDSAIDTKYNALERELDDKIREVNAHLDAIDMNSNSDNKVDLMYGILEEYGIIDSRLHIVDYKLPMEEIKEEEVEEPTQEEEAPKGKKRGRKPNKTDENK